MTTTTLNDIMDLDLLAEMVDGGYIRQQFHPDDAHLYILNYTEKAAFERVWNDATLNCRGLIVRRDPEGLRQSTVLARPFKKFFNFGENGRDDYDMDARVEVTDKMDGSLGILYPAPDGLPAIATRGSFTSPQALHATEVYRERYHGKWSPYEEDTYLFEIVYPENRIVLDYGGVDDLVHIGAVHTADGRTFSPGSSVTIDGWPGPVTTIFPAGTLREALALAARENAEGLVVRYRHKEEMVKIKQDDYVALHRIIFGLNERAVWERMMAGEGVDEINSGLPEEFHPWVVRVSRRLLSDYQEIAQAALYDFNEVINRVGWYDRKAFALRAKQSDYQKYLFLLFDGKPLGEAIWKAIKPEHAPYASSAITADN